MILRAHLLAGYTQDPLVSIAGKEVDAYSLGADNSQDMLRGVIAREVRTHNDKPESIHQDEIPPEIVRLRAIVTLSESETFKQAG
jgi:hypothetical protein